MELEVAENRFSHVKETNFHKSHKTILIRLPSKQIYRSRLTENVIGRLGLSETII